ncbi:hypothetical protein [Endozoicomonas sp. Mp262]|uniref:hypothetical protein n=1 Tax=Endozoicomonas sp. Mp262 TaxID=2919499 RepID=UPI0021DA76D2
MVSDLQFAQLDERVTRLEYWRTLKDEHLEYLIKEHNDLLQLLLEKVGQFEEVQRRFASRLDRQQEQLDRQQEQIEKMVTKDDFNSFKADVMTTLQQLLNRQH